MEIKFKNLTFKLTNHDDYLFPFWTATWQGFSGEGRTKEKAIRACYAMIQEDAGDE